MSNKSLTNRQSITVPNLFGKSTFAFDTKNSYLIDKKSNIASNLTGQYFSAKTTEIIQKIREFEADKTNTLQYLGAKNKSIIQNIANETHKNLDEKLFDASASIKILISNVSMHFSEEFRKKLFLQIDLLHNPDDWEDGDFPIQANSFSTFLRWFYLNQPSNLPNFGLTDSGHLIASWVKNENRDRLILEFLSADRIKWYITIQYDEDIDYSNGMTNLFRIIELLAPYNIVEWLSKAE